MGSAGFTWPPRKLTNKLSFLKNWEKKQNIFHRPKKKISFYKVSRFSLQIFNPRCFFSSYFWVFYCTFTREMWHIIRRLSFTLTGPCALPPTLQKFFLQFSIDLLLPVFPVSTCWKWNSKLIKFIHTNIYLFINVVFAEISAHQKSDFSKGGVHRTDGVVMGDFSKGGVHKTDGFWWVIFQRGEYMKPMGCDGWFFKGGSTQNQWLLECFFIASKN